MASLAGLLKQRGFKVTGSDAAAYPPMSDFLASITIPILQPYSETQPEAATGHGDCWQRDLAR